MSRSGDSGGYLRRFTAGDDYEPLPNPDGKVCEFYVSWGGEACILLADTPGEAVASALRGRQICNDKGDFRTIQIALTYRHPRKDTGGYATGKDTGNTTGSRLE